MARRSNQKLKLLYLSKILLDNTDERHGLTLSQILSELQAYGLEAGRKSLYEDMEALRVYGLDIRTKRDRYVRYYIHNRNFDRAEIRLLIDAVSGSSMLTEKKSNELIKKLNTLRGMSQVYVECHTQKAFSEDIYNNVNSICKAIELGKKLNFRCFEWNSQKQRILVSGGEFFTVSPQRLAFKDGKYILSALDHTTKKHTEFFVDKIINLSVLNTSSENAMVNDEIDGNAAVSVCLRCDNSVAGEIFDRFGLGVTILANRDEYFEVAVKSILNERFYSWLFAMGAKVKIISPDSAAEEYKKLLTERLERAGD